MKNLIPIALMVLGTSVNAQKVDINESTLKWTGEKVTGSHYGNIILKDANLNFDKGNIANGVFVIDMNSITCTDLEDATYNEKLVGHLKSDDFFGVANHPEAVLKITESTPFKNNTAEVKANLTIKGITNPVSFVVNKKGLTYSAVIKVDRSKYNVKYGSGSFFSNLGDNLIYDVFTLDVNIVTK